MRKILNCWYSLMLLCLAVVVVSCSDDNETPAVEEPSYELDYKVTARQDAHAMATTLNDMLNLHFKQIVFEYTSLGPDMKTPVRLTGVISMNSAVYDKSAKPRGLMLYNEFTTAKHKERTSQNELDDIGLYMNKYQNMIAVSADLYGWTLTEDKPQAYCCPDITAVETMDAWDAAMKILKEEGYEIDGLPCFNVGYSSGGYSAMAVQRYTDANRPDITWDLTSVGGAPFDINAVYKSNIASETSGYACSFPLIVVAYKETYHLDFEYSEVFAQPLCDSIQSWILSKDYNTWEINSLIAGGDEEMTHNCPVTRILSASAMDTTSVVAQKLMKKFRENSLCGDGQTWQPSTKTKYYILHSSADRYLDWHVGKEMADYLTAHGCTVTTSFGNYGNHVEYGLICHILATMWKMENFTTNSKVVKEQMTNGVLEKATQYLNTLPDL